MIALKDVETGAWLDGHGIGLTCVSLDDAGQSLEAMTPDRYATLAAGLQERPQSLFVAGRDDCVRLVQAIVHA